MSKLCKRFFSLALALIMLLSCMSFASAAEVEEQNFLSVPSLSAVQPRATVLLMEGETGGSSGGSSGLYSGGTTLTSSQYFTIVVSTRTTCYVDVWGGNGNGGFWEGSLTIPSTNGKAVQRSVTCNNGIFPPAYYHYSITFENPNESYAFQFFRTDYYHNT